MSSNEKNNLSLIICDLDLKKYSGKWYEIGKLPAPGQSGLRNVTATYTPQKNGKIRVVNVGYKKGKKKGIKGYAWQREKDCTGGLHVRFFWPFKGEYNVIMLAPDYRYAVVMGEDKSSLWILSRTPEMKKDDSAEVFRFLAHHSFDVKRITKTKQDGND